MLEPNVTCHGNWQHFSLAPGAHLYVCLPRCFMMVAGESEHRRNIHRTCQLSVYMTFWETAETPRVAAGTPYEHVIRILERPEVIYKLNSMRTA